METLKLSDLICGEIYYSEAAHLGIGIKTIIFIYEKCADDGCDTGYAIYNNSFIRNLSLDKRHLNNLREATTEEELWLNTCIKENKYLSKEEALKKTSNYSFEIGKYYHFVAGINSTHIAKCDRLEKEDFESDNWIFCNGPWDKLMSGVWEIILMSDIKELSLEEIQQYLPNEHPDKIKYTQLKVGDWVVVTKRYENNSAKVGNVCCISTIDVSSTVRYEVIDKNNIYNWAINPTWCIDVRKATQEEIDSVSKPKELVEEPICETCNGTGQVMTAKLYPTGHTEVNEDCPDCDGGGFIDTEIKPVVKEYLEYYESVKEKAKSFTKGKIYKIKNPSNLEEGGNFIDDAGMENGFAGINYTHFKPSTKEAFDLQESKSKLITNMSNNKYKIGDIVDTNDRGWQYADFDVICALNVVKSSILQNKLITNVEYSKDNLNWWYSFSDGENNWYTESSIIGLSKQKIKDTPNSSVIEDFQIKCNSEEESKLCEKWAISKGLLCRNSFLYTGNWSYFKVIGRCYIINGTRKDSLLEKTLNDIDITKDIPEVLTHSCTNTVISNPINPETPKYDLSTTITRAINENNPNIIAIESGKSIDEICEGLTDDYCRLSNFRHNTKVNCSNSWCSLCKFHRDNNTLEQTKDWLKGIKSNDTNPTLKNPIVEEFEITPITISKEPDFTTINSIYDRIPDVEY